MTMTKNGIQQLRPPPLKISKNSCLIQKPIIMKHNNNISLPPLKTSNKKGRQQRQPVIIYARSPKAIHTTAKDFMELVQKLTGMSAHVDGDEEEIERREEDNFSHPLATLGENGGSTVSSPAVEVAGFDDSTRTLDFFADIPLFTPDSSDLICTPRIYRNSVADVVVPTSMVMQLAERTFNGNC